LLLFEHFVSRGHAHWYYAVLALYGIALVANILSWAIYGGIYTLQDRCTSTPLYNTTTSYKQDHWILSWGFGFRLLETGFSLVLIILTALNSGRGEARHPTHYVATLWALVLLLFAVLSTSGRGWMWNKDLGETWVDNVENAPEWNWEVGLWDVCYCKQFFRFDCATLRRRAYVAEVFSVIAVFFQFFFIAFLLKGATRFAQVLQKIIGAGSVISMIIVLTVYNQFFQTSYCDMPSFSGTQRLHWAYGIFAVALIFQVFSLIVIFLTPVEAAAAAEAKPTEPTASE